MLKGLCHQIDSNFGDMNVYCWSAERGIGSGIHLHKLTIIVAPESYLGVNIYFDEMATFKFLNDIFIHIVWNRKSKTHLNCLDFVPLSAVFLFTIYFFSKKKRPYPEITFLLATGSDHVLRFVYERFP
jgi:hypothetical protein